MAMPVTTTNLKDATSTTFGCAGTSYTDGINTGLARYVALIVNNGSGVPVEAGASNPLPVSLLSVPIHPVTQSGSWSVGLAKPISGAFTDRSGSIAAGGTAQAVAAANAARKTFLFQNNSAADLWLNFTTTAVVGSPSWLVSAGQAFWLTTNVTTEAVSVIGATTGQTYSAKEV